MPKLSYLLMIPLLLLVMWLGAHYLDFDAMWLDEWWTYTTATGEPHYEPIGPGDIIRRASDEGFHPPTQYLLLAGWAGLVGWSLPATRTLSLFLGLLATAWTYRLGHDLARDTDLNPVLVGLSTAVAFGGSAFVINYLHEVRAYAYFVLFTSICLWAYWHVLTARRLTVPNQLSFVVGMVGMLYAHYAAILIAAAVGLYHLFFVRRSARWWRIAGLGIFAGFTFVPWIATGLRTTDSFTDDAVRQALALAPAPMVQGLVSQFSNGNVLLLIALGWFAFSVRRRPTFFIGFISIGALILAFIVNHFLGFIAHPRYLIGFWPLLALVVGFGVAQLAQRYHVPPALFLGLWLAAGVGLSIDPGYLRMVNGGAFWHLPWNRYEAEIQSHAQPGDVALMQLPDVVWQWMHGPVADYYFHDLPVEKALIESLPGMDDAAFFDQVREAVAGARRVWFGYDPQQESLRKWQLEAALNEDFAPCTTPADSEQFYLSLYVDPAQVAYALQFDDRIQLALLEPIPEMVDSRLDVLLGWSIAEDVPPHTYSVGLHVVDANNQLVAQADDGLPVVDWACQPVSFDFMMLSPGDYRLLAVVYAWESGERLLGRQIDTGATGDRLLLGAFTLRD